MDFYSWIKALHIVSVIAWMAGMFYLPRLFVYHADAEKNSELSETLKVMERRLAVLIINPAMIATFVFGVWILILVPAHIEQTWMQVKLAGLVGMTGVYGAFSRWRRFFERDANCYSARFYRIVNEIPTVLMVVIVFMAVLKPE